MKAVTGRILYLQKIFEQYMPREDEDIEKKLIRNTSPPQAESQRRVKLQDVKVSKKDKDRLREFCKEYEEIFSKSSEDIGHTSLLKMGRYTGDSPPTCQKPYSLPLNHVEWVT